MKKILFATLLLISFAGCKKTIEKIQEDLVVAAMTDGYWQITSFIQNGTDISSDFTDYKFQFFKDNTVNAIRNNVIEKKGTWQGDVETTTITASFPNGGQPLEWISGSWHVDKNSWTSVEASKLNTTGTSMHLQKL